MLRPTKTRYPLCHSCLDTATLVGQRHTFLWHLLRPGIATITMAPTRGEVLRGRPRRLVCPRGGMGYRMWPRPWRDDE